MSREVKTPGPDHSITIERNPHRVAVRVAGAVVADTTSALTLREAGYPRVEYIPWADVDTARLRRSDTHTYCPYKRQASYYAVASPEEDTSRDAVWTYEEPYAAVDDIADHVAFYQEHAAFSSS